MDCQQIDALLDEQATGALSAAQQGGVEAHLAGCQRCTDAWFAVELLTRERPAAARPGLYRQLADRVLAQAPTASPPAHATVAPRLAVRVRQSMPARFGIAATAIAVAGLAGWFAFGGGTVAPGRAGVAPAPAAVIGEFMAGRDYERVREPSPQFANGPQIQVCEFFMFDCIYCFDFEASLASWEATLPDVVSLERVPALFNSRARLHAQAFYAAEVLGASADLSMPFYEEIHAAGNRLDTVRDIREFFVRRGIATADFDAAFASPAVAARLRRAEELNALYGVTATPSLGVNGRYLTNPGLAGSNERMLAVVDAIVADETQGRCDASGRSSCPFE
jgi:thiol:disulfide interchange protein DsbA